MCGDSHSLPLDQFAVLLIAEPNPGRSTPTHANSVLTNALPRLADELVTMAMDKSVKPYSRIAAISEAFKIVNSNVLEAEQRKQLQAIRAHLDRLEDGQTIDV